MELIHALRLDTPASLSPVLSFAGAGGKTTALFQAARQLARKNKRVFVAATTQLGVWQTPLADLHLFEDNLQNIPDTGIILISGPIEGGRTKPISNETLNWLREKSKSTKTPLLIEADGSKQKPLKAPDQHEPPIPVFSNTVICVAGLSAIGKPLIDENVHRAQIFTNTANTKIGSVITPENIIAHLTHPQGGQKNIPAGARKIVFLNQADGAELQSTGGKMAGKLLQHFDSVIVGSLKNETFRTFEHTAAIILAAGESTRYGAPKQLLDWNGKPFVRQIVETAAQAGLWPIVIITGSHAADVRLALSGLDINIIYNPDYENGQSTSIKTGVDFIQKLPNKNIGSAIFLLADQPQIPSDVMRALTELHSQELHPIVAPLVLEERRANPVLFDRVTFPDLMKLQGDVGGRAIFDKHKVEYLPWHDDILLLDVDKPEDYQRLMQVDKL